MIFITSSLEISGVSLVLQTDVRGTLFQPLVFEAARQSEDAVPVLGVGEENGNQMDTRPTSVWEGRDQQTSKGIPVDFF